MKNEPSADYPLGGSIEPYDIEIEKETTREARCRTCGGEMIPDIRNGYYGGDLCPSATCPAGQPGVVCIRRSKPQTPRLHDRKKAKPPTSYLKKI